MKLIRLTDDRYILDAGPDMYPDDFKELERVWTDWWNTHPGVVPQMLVIGGAPVKVEYDDRRESNVEVRLQRLEKWFHVHNIQVEENR